MAVRAREGGETATHVPNCGNLNGWLRRAGIREAGRTWTVETCDWAVCAVTWSGNCGYHDVGVEPFGWGARGDMYAVVVQAGRWELA